MERHHQHDHPVRPRFGLLTRQDGSQLVLVFHPTEKPNTFAARRADTEEPVRMLVTDRLTVDEIGDNQSLLFA